MGKDRACPDDCPVGAYASLSASDRKARRKPLAEELYRNGMTMEQIAAELHVAVDTISQDLKFSEIGKSKPAKTVSNPKGAGRPKGKQNTKHDAARQIIRSRIEAGQPLKTRELEKEHGISVDSFERAAAAEHARLEALREKTALDPSHLSKSAQEKLDAAISAHKTKLDASFHTAVNDEVRKRIDEIVLPHWKQQIEQAQELFARRRGLMDKETFNTIRRALHPDSRHSISDGKLGEAFDAFMALEKFLLAEKDSPTEFPDLPETWADWEKAKQRATAARRRSPRALRTK
jgi:hypothetical protein